MSAPVKGISLLGKGHSVLRFALLVAVLFALAIPASSALADPGDVGYQDFSYAGTSTPSGPTGTKRSENVTWWNDGHWWADMWDTVSQDYHIFKLDNLTQTWQDTGTAVDPRITSHADTLWDGTKLYVASHLFVNDEVPAATGGDSRLYRYSYDSTTQTYSLDAGFPAQINVQRVETLVIDKDSTGKLWATWQQDNQIYLNSTQGDDLTWGTPFALPAAHSGGLTVDDNSALVHVGNKIGVMWSDQTDVDDAFYFAFHNDGDADDVWQPTETAVAGPLVADDHLSLKSTSDGRVIAAVKTSYTDYREALTLLLVRDTAGTWTNHNITLASQCPNRPTVLIDEVNDVLHVLETGPAAPDFSCNTTGGAIYSKTSSLSNISFDDANSGTLVMHDADAPALHNVSGTKQNVTPTSGLAALAINALTKFYWHHYETLPEPPPPGEAPVAAFSGTPTTGTAPLTVSFADASTKSPTAWSWDFGDGTSSSEQSPSHVYTQPGTYTVTLTVTNDFGTSAETKVNYLTVVAAAPVASFTSSATSGDAPLTVSFADTSTGAPTSYRWRFGDGGTSTAKNPSYTYMWGGVYTVTLTVSNANGTNTVTRTGYVTVKDFMLTASPLSRDITPGQSTTYNINIAPRFGYAGSVNLAVSGLPSGASASFSRSSVTVPPSGSSTLSVSTTSSTPKGHYDLVVTGRGPNGLIRPFILDLHVKKPPGKP